MPRALSTDATRPREAYPGTAGTHPAALLTAKLEPPGLAHPTVLRPRLLTALTRAVQRFPLTLVSGPAGSGKTVLAASWREAEGRGHPIAWLTLDDYDDDPATFWSYVVEALSGAVAPLSAVARLVPGEPLPSGFLPSLAAAVAASAQSVVLVLDNADHLTDRAVTSGLDLLVRHAGSRLRLVMCTRADPQLPLHQYRLAGTMAEIRGQQLAFTAEETGALFTAMGVSAVPDVVARLCAETQGWAVGLHLAAAQLTLGGEADQLATSLAHDDGSVAQYLFAEVLAGQPAHVRRFLLRVSATAELWPDLVDRLTGRPHGRRMLAALARANAFVEESVGAPGGYRIHPLFREMLLAQLGFEHPGEVLELHRTCAAWFAAHGGVVEAVGHAVATGDWAFTSRLLVDDLVVPRLLAHGSDPVLRGVPPVPGDVRGTEAAVLRAATALAAGGRPVPADLALVATAAVTGERPALRVSAAFTHLQIAATAPIDRAGFVARIEAAERALGALPGDGGRERRDCVGLLTGARALAAVCGDDPVDEVIPALRAAAGAAQAAGARSLRGRAIALSAVLEAVDGHLARAGQHAAEVEADTGGAGTEDADGSWAAAIATACVHLQRYALTEAREWLGRAGARQRRCPAGPESEALEAVLAVLQSRMLRLRREYDAAGDCLHAQVTDGTGPRWARQAVAREAVRLAFARGHLEEGLGLAEADVLDVADRDRLRALGHLVRGDGGDGASLLRDDGGAPAVAVEVRVIRACQLAEAGSAASAVDELARALALARPELLRLPFVDAPAQARRLLRGHPRLAAPAGWLNPSAPVIPVPRAPGSAELAEPAPALTQDLSERETEVLQHLAEMLSTAEIAATMFISVNTVRTHIRSILRKLGVSRRNQAVRRARERGLL